MMNFTTSICFILCLIITLLACKQEEAPACTYPHQITLDSGCYTGTGLIVTASDFGTSPSLFEWTIIALKDTTGASGWTPKDVKIVRSASEKFTIPDSLASNYQRVIVKAAATNCGDALKHSN
ncbi:hypothetical protein [Spirosoma luteum]|uniref:hypothetical protein n=1 Tax=Spirosoma luteum TaxID=431553 RepID=UPI000377D3DC|nr:hypothetical protein [Spirosoma luteum]